jgi:hypothetical protein
MITLKELCIQFLIKNQLKPNSKSIDIYHDYVYSLKKNVFQELLNKTTFIYFICNTEFSACYHILCYYCHDKNNYWGIITKQGIPINFNIKFRVS